MKKELNHYDMISDCIYILYTLCKLGMLSYKENIKGLWQVDIGIGADLVFLFIMLYVGLIINCIIFFES